MTIYDHLRNAEAELLAAAGEEAPAEIRTALYDLLYSLADLRGNMPHAKQWPEGEQKGNLFYDDAGIKPCGTVNVYSAVNPEEFADIASRELRHQMGY